MQEEYGHKYKNILCYGLEDILLNLNKIISMLARRLSEPWNSPVFGRGLRGQDNIKPSSRL